MSEELGLSDDCFELQTLRSLRDTHMSKTEAGRHLISVYALVAPAILDSLATNQRKAFFQKAYVRYILPAVFLTKFGLHTSAVNVYVHFVRDMANALESEMTVKLDKMISVPQL